MAVHLVTRKLAGSDGRCMFDDVRHVVELRCGRTEGKPGIWSDAWRAVGVPWVIAEMARLHADELRAKGHTVRVRPVVL